MSNIWNNIVKRDLKIIKIEQSLTLSDHIKLILKWKSKVLG
jgi:hypothetical protein